jgi:hypothetical protein
MTLSGGIGNDTMNGGNGSDTFVFAPGFGDDVIRGLDANPAGGQDFYSAKLIGCVKKPGAAHPAHRATA